MKTLFFALIVITMETFSVSGQEVLSVGGKAPLFKATTDNGSVWDINKYLGDKFIVVYFYPAAMTGGCTKQACSYRDHRDELSSAGIVVVGISGDKIENLQYFKKAENLNSIYSQLQSVEVKNIIRFLEGNKSTYTNPFAKLQKDVQNARIEANDNNKFLKTLKDLFMTLRENEFKQCQETFMPIMHTILLIWKNSKFYNTPPRLVVLIREICNEIIKKGQNYLPGQAILDFIQRDETFEACTMLQDTIDVCTKFKDAYFEYKSKAEGSWKLTTNALFVRLDSFLERYLKFY